MQKNLMTFKQQIFLIFMFVLGSNVVLGVNITAENDTWIALLLATVCTIPLVLIYARILKLFPGKDIFDMLEMLLGKIFGKILIALFTWYSIHLCALVLRNFSEYVEIIAMPETPPLVVMICLMLVIMYLAKSNLRTLGEWAIITGMIVIFTICLTIILEIKDMQISNIFPILPNGLNKVFLGAFQIITFPFAETVVFLSLGNTIRKNDSAYKIYLYAILFSSFMMLLVVLRNLVMLGLPMIEASYFPSFVTARLIEIGDFLSRIEGTISVNLVLAGICKITVCLICAAKGITKLFNIEHYQKMILSTSLFVLALSINLYRNVLEMFEFIKYYPYYAIPFQVFIPVTVWITGEVYTKKHKTLCDQNNC